MMSRRDRRRERNAIVGGLMAGFVLLLLSLTVWICAANWPDAAVLLRRMGGAAEALGGRLWSWLPLPMSEVLLIALLPLTVFVTVRACMRGRVRVLLSWVFCALCLVLFCFVAGHGVQYTAPSVAEELGLRRQDVTVGQLETLTRSLVEEMNTLAPAMTRGRDGVVVFEDFSVLRNKVMAAWDETAARCGLKNRRVAAPKRSVILSVPMSYLGNAGYFFPWTGESVVNYDALPTSYPFNIAHESAHARGCGPEDAANFLAWLVCSGSDDPELRYSAAFNALIYAGNALNSVDPARWSAVLSELCAEGRSDLTLHSAQVRKYDGRIREAGDRVNDRYIRATGQSAGIRSYGLMVDLMVAWNERGN